MMRVFVPGDAILLADVDFDDISPGDVVVFNASTPSQELTIHRVIARTADSLTTQGDNNAEPDTPITRANNPRLAVRRILPNGTSQEILRSDGGLAQFRRNQRKRAMHRLASSLLRPLLPLMFWRIRLTETHIFGNEIHYYHNGKFIGRKAGNSLQFCPVWKILLYKI